MKITNITTHIEKIPLRTPFITALRRVEDVEFVRVSITTDESIVSFGEAPATKAITGEDLDTITNAVESNKELFYGLTSAQALESLDSLDIGSSAKASLDMAFCALIDPQIDGFVEQRDENYSKIKTAITISFNDIEKMIADSHDAMNRGHSILKIKLGSDIDHAIEVTKAISNNFNDATLLIDANQAWSVDDSKRYLDGVESIDIELLEQPVPAKDIDGLKELKNYSKIPIVADEACFSIDDVKKVVESNSADIINIKLMKCGGVTKAEDILKYCRKKNVPVMFGSMLEGPISIAYACYLVDKYPEVVKYVDLDSPLLYK